MKFPKPGAKKKPAKIKNKSPRIHDIDKPKKLNCRKCGIETGTERFCHLETFRKHSIGKGVGIKCNDWATAWLCQNCANVMDHKPDKNDELAIMIHAEEWNWLIIKTHLIDKT